MKESYVKAIEVAKEYKVYLKVVTAVRSFDSYNSFFNIYDEQEEACRRIAVLTPFKDLEEVYDKNPSEKIENSIIVDENIWLTEYPLTTNPAKIVLDDIMVDVDMVNKVFAIK